MRSRSALRAPTIRSARSSTMACRWSRARQINTTGVPHGAVSGGVIDSHIFIDADGSRYLFWKDDSNGIWPRPLAMLLRERPELIERSFERDEDSSARPSPPRSCRGPTAAGRWSASILMTGMIEAALANWQEVKNALVEYGLAGEILDAMVTPVRGAADRRRRTLARRRIDGRADQRPRLGRPSDRGSVLHAGRRAATGCSTPATISERRPMASGLRSPTMCSAPIASRASLCSSRRGAGPRPGHASVAPGLDDEPQLFFHAFHPGTGGYNAFRALLTAKLGSPTTGLNWPELRQRRDRPPGKFLSLG